MARDSIEERADELRRPQPHILVSLVDQQLAHRQLVGRDRRELARHLVDNRRQLLRRNRLRSEADALRFATRERFTGEHHSLGVFEPQTVDPHHGSRLAPNACGRIADLGVLGHVDEVRAERHVRATADAPTVYLRDHRLRALPERHEDPDIARHSLVVAHRVPVPGHLALRRVFRSRAPVEVISRAERPASSAEDHHSHGPVLVRGDNRVPQVGDKPPINRVQPRRPV